MTSEFPFAISLCLKVRATVTSYNRQYNNLNKYTPKQTSLTKVLSFCKQKYFCLGSGNLNGVDLHSTEQTHIHAQREREISNNKLLTQPSESIPKKTNKKQQQQHKKHNLNSLQRTFSPTPQVRRLWCCWPLSWPLRPHCLSVCLFVWLSSGGVTRTLTTHMTLRSSTLDCQRPSRHS